MDVGDTNHDSRVKRIMDTFLVRKRYCLIAVLFWTLIGTASSMFRINSYKQDAILRASTRGIFMCQSIIAAHMSGSDKNLNSRGSFDNSFVENLNFNKPINSFPDSRHNLTDKKYNIITSFPNKYSSTNASDRAWLSRLSEQLTEYNSMSDHDKDWLSWLTEQTEKSQDTGRRKLIKFNLNASPSRATYTLPVITTEACLKCHSGENFIQDKIQMGIEVTYPTDDFLIDYNNHRFSNIITDTIICTLLAIATIIVIQLINSYYLKLQTATSQLVENEKMASLGSMVAGFSHELKTPIGIAVSATSQISETIKEMSELFKRDEVSEDEIMEPMSTLDESYQLISNHLERANDMIKRFRSTVSELTFDDKHTFIFQDLFNDLKTDMKHLHKNSNITINISCPPKLAMYASISAIRQIVYNLYTNAIKYAFLDGSIAGTISIKCSLTKDQIKITFTDDGCGMSSQTFKHIFEPFYTTSRNSGGTGLGLFIVYTLATRTLGGTIKCYSTLGEGTHFELSLPYDKQHES